MAALLKKVLVVDDDPVVAKSFGRVLAGKGYMVMTAGNGEEALDKLTREDYDLVYTDIRMPGMDGIEVAEQVKARRPWIPVVIVTGYGTSENEAKAKQIGVSAFLHKPLSPEMIEGSAREALAGTVAGIAAALGVAGAVPEARPEAATETAEPERGGSAAKNVALFLAAPFIALAYILAFPFVGIAMLVWIGTESLRKNGTARMIGLALKNVGLLIAAPFIGLALVLVVPFVGLGALAWMGVKALWTRENSE